MMNYYAKRAERAEAFAKSVPDDPPPGTAPPPSAAAQPKGHHMGDFIPPEEMAKFLASCGDAKALAQAAAQATADRIGAENKGHQLLAKMGWKEGTGLGAGGAGRVDPLAARGAAGAAEKTGLGAQAVGEVSADDDIYEQYKKRMMLGYKHRPNPLNNPRKAYY